MDEFIASFLGMIKYKLKLENYLDKLMCVILNIKKLFSSQPIISKN